MNNGLHDRILDLESQVIKANDNLQTVLKGMERYIKKNIPFFGGAFVEMLDYVKGLIDWELTIDESRHEEEMQFRGK